MGTFGVTLDGFELSFNLPCKSRRSWPPEATRGDGASNGVIGP